MPGEITTSNLG